MIVDFSLHFLSSSKKNIFHYNSIQIGRYFDEVYRWIEQKVYDFVPFLSDFHNQSKPRVAFLMSRNKKRIASRADNSN